MAFADLQSECVHALSAAGKKPKKRGDLYEFHCVQHSDKSPSAWVGNAKWGCLACGIEEPITRLCEMLGVAVPRSGGLTVEQYAELKGLPLDALHRWGVKTIDGKYGDLVEIPYYDADGVTVLRTKLRQANGKTHWGSGTGTYLYGLQMLAKAKPEMPVLVVEGESDCHAAWSKGVLAVGVPGATSWKPEWAPVLSGRQLYVWQEPGDAGAKFAQSLAADFPEARIIRSETHKDLADLYKTSPRDLKAALDALKAEALPIGVIPPAIKYASLTGSTLAALLTRKLAPIDAVPTPLTAWNRACRNEGGGIGMARGWNVTIAGNTGHGKSLLALNVGAAAIAHGERVAFHSIEMSQMQLATQALSIVSGISIRRLEQGAYFNVDDWKTASLRMDEVRERTGGDLLVNEAPISKLEDIEAAIRYQTEYRGCRFHIVDYLQLCVVAGAKNVVEAVPIVSGKMRVLAKELGVVMVGLSQFNRETSKEREQRPHIQGLMGGSALENDSDQVLLLNHTVYRVNGDHADTEALLAKNRHGPKVDIPVTWDYRTLTLTEQRGDSWEPEGEEGAAA